MNDDRFGGARRTIDSVRNYKAATFLAKIG